MRDFKLCWCGIIIEKADKYCHKCKIEVEKKIIERNKRYDKFFRDSKSTAFYHSTAWGKIVKLVRTRDNELCQLCYADNRITKGRIIHHIVPIKDNWNKRLDPINCICLCDACHTAVHKKYDNSRQDKAHMQQHLKKIISDYWVYFCKI